MRFPTMPRLAAIIVVARIGVACGQAYSAGSSPANLDGGTVAADAMPSLNCPAGCLAPAPPGGKGPSAFFAGPEDQRPKACPPFYSQLELEAHEGLHAEPAHCSCGSPLFDGGACTATVQLYATTDCSGTPTTETISAPTKFCTTQTVGSATRVRVVTPTFVGGGCEFPKPTKTTEHPTYDRVDIACSLPAPTACSNRTDCVAAPSPDEPFGRFCLLKDGDEACPSADYPFRILAHRGFNDTRACSPCSGTVDGGSCGSYFTFTPQYLCGSYPSTTLVEINKCVPPSGNNHAHAGPLGPFIQCEQRGGDPTGAVTPRDPVTLCCNR